MILSIYGHVVIICIGLPVIAGVVYNLRSRRVKRLILNNPDKLGSDIDALMQIIAIEEIIENALSTKVDDIWLIGIINTHIVECQDNMCYCKNESGLYDPSTKTFIDSSIKNHRNIIFLKYFIKQLYEDALNKFTNSVQLHISFAYYLFTTMNNLHASLLQVNIAEKKKPTFSEEFALHKRKAIMEILVKEKSKEAKSIYTQLTNITEYEELLVNCQKAIERVVTFQADFWAQVANQLPDLNILRTLSKHIYNHSEEAACLWDKMCQINPNYPKALNIYGNYLLEIRHHNQLAHELLDR